MKKPLWSYLGLLVVIATIIPAFVMAIQPSSVPVTPFQAVNPSESRSEVSNTTTLLFLGNQNIAPIVYLDGTTPSGVAVDIVHALATHMSQPVEIRAMNWSEAQVLVAMGDGDALIQINPTEERKKIYDFSEPLLESHFSIFTRSDTIGISGISSLRGLLVGVESGGLPQRLLETEPQVRLTIIPNFTEGFRQLNGGSVDAVVLDYRVGSYVLAKNNIRNIKVTGEPISSSTSSIAVKKGNTKLLNEINNALQIIRADGTYQKIIENWQLTEAVFETQEQITNRIYYVIILILLILFLVAVVWTITIKKELLKRKIAEETLSEQYSTLRGIINSTNARIFSVDSQYRYTSFNLGHATTMKELYGAEIERGHSQLDYMTVAEDRKVAKRNFDRALAGEEHIEEAYLGEILQSRRYLQVSHSPIKRGEEIIGVAVLAQDITDRKLAEKELQTLYNELEQRVSERTADLKLAHEALYLANKKLNLLSGITRHDINNQLTVLIGFLSLLEKKQPDTTFSEYFCKIGNAAERISTMIRFTKEYESIGVTEPAWQDCRTLVDTAVRQAQLKQVIVNNSLPTGAEVFADPMIVKVFYNLIDNAVRYGGKISNIHLFSQELGDNYLIVCEDDGEGITAEEKEKIFERGFGKNTGLGLSLSREILDITGIILCENGELEKGARFEITVPKGKWRYGSESN